MAGSRVPQRCLTIEGAAPGRTPGCLGRNDAGDPNCVAVCSDTPGSTGVNDLAARIAMLPMTLTLDDTTSEKQFTLLPTYWLVLDDFNIDQAAVPPKYTSQRDNKLDEFAKRLCGTLAVAPDSLIYVTGFADAPGTDEHNLALGKQRAAAVARLLADRGVPENAMHLDSMGEDAPVVTTRRHEGKNRRVEIDVFERKPGTGLLNQKLTPPQTPGREKKLDLTVPLRPPTNEEELNRFLKLKFEEEKRRPGVTIGDLFGKPARKLAVKLGLPEWVQDAVEAAAQSIPTKSAQAVFDQATSDARLDPAQKEAVHKIIEGLIKLDLANPKPKVPEPSPTNMK